MAHAADAGQQQCCEPRFNPAKVRSWSYSMNVRSAALGLICLLALLPAPARAFTEIEVRKDHDGAGPSHIFQLHDGVVAVVDPLGGTISAYADTHDAPVRTANMPVGFRPWRLVRLPSSVAIISEDGRSRIEVARDQTVWPHEFALSEHHASDAAYRVAPLARTSAGIMLQPFHGAGALAIRAIGPYYVASARELERFADGRRYVLWKEYYVDDPPAEEPDEPHIKVNVYVGRFERDGTLSGVATLPIAVMSRVGFDYATILPEGTIALLASIVANGRPGPFKIYHLAFAKPSSYLAALQKAAGRARHWADPPPVADIFPIAEPKVTAVDGSRSSRADAGEQTRPVLPRAEMRQQMDAYRDHRWTLLEANRRNPCSTVIMPGVEIVCRNQLRFVLPSEQERLRTPVAMRGVPYDWGGNDSLERFDDKIERGFIAGNIGGTFWSPGSRRVTAGVDCSGLVSNVWHLDHHAGTSELPDLTEPVARLDRMRVGDVLLRPDHHVALYREQVDLDGASIGIRVTEAASRCGGVCDSIYELDHFQDYMLRRFSPER
jgi:hypothetical protein